MTAAAFSSVVSRLARDSLVFGGGVELVVATANRLWANALGLKPP